MDTANAEKIDKIMINKKLRSVSGYTTNTTKG
jgi:hypothetical protein